MATPGFADHCGVEEDAIAIIGMACRYPGEASDIEGFWKLILDARSAHSEMPEGRYNAKSYYHPSFERAGAISTTGGYFLKEGADRFDASFFSITAVEAAGMDPQQRQLLEVAYETFENAGIPIDRIARTNTGCYVGSFCDDYRDVSQNDIYQFNQYASTGNGSSMLANRISWFYDLTGPSLVIDTACSSSMYALHLACQSLRTGESDMGLVGGSNVILSPGQMRTLSAMRFLSPTGKCHSYDHLADGYARGEGVGMILLKKLSKAIADGDTIRSVIRASGLNQDGKTPGITMPSPTAQASLIRQCYSQAELPLHETSYFEGHGTGTALGDPIEVQAIGDAFAGDRDKTNPLYIGSVKANIGHQEGGAGIAAIIRVALALEKGMIPPTAELEQPNPMLNLSGGKLALATKALPWPVQGVRRASVNSFGYGGANSHAILEDAYHYMKDRRLEGNHVTCPGATLLYDSDTDSDSGFSSGMPSAVTESPAQHSSLRRNLVFPFSAIDQAGLHRMLERYATFLQHKLEDSKLLGVIDEQSISEFVADLAFTLAHRRTRFDHRTAIVADGIPSLLAQLKGNTPSTKKIVKTGQIAFVFNGQGAQYFQMGQALLGHEVFAESLGKAQATIASLGCTWDLAEELAKPDGESRINLPEYSQPLCTALQLALVDLLASWGIFPKAAVGHSSGEIAAAYAAGGLSHEHAMLIAYQRGVLSGSVVARQTTKKKGAMLAVGVGRELAAEYLASHSPGDAVIACINSPESVTLSGDLETIDALEARFNAADVFARKLKTSDTAYHSPHMQVIAEDYLKAISSVVPMTTPSDVRMFSSVTGAEAGLSDLGPSYWVANLVQPVNFANALQSLLAHCDKPRRKRRTGTEYSSLIEIGPSGALKGPINQVLIADDANNASSVLYVSALQRGQAADFTILEMMGRLWSRGKAVDYSLVNDERKARHALKVLPDLPSYQWNHSASYWHEPNHTKRADWEPRSDLLGACLSHRNVKNPHWHNFIKISENPWLADHKIHTAVLYPGAAMIVMALEAAQRLAERSRVVKAYQFRDITFSKALMLPADGRQVEIELFIQPYRIGSRASTAPWNEFNLVAIDEQGEWHEHCTGQFQILYNNGATEVDGGLQQATFWADSERTYNNIKGRLSTKLSKKAFYKRAFSMGMQYGPMFQGIEDVTVGDQECHAVVAVPDTKSVMPHGFEFSHLIHAATLDSIFQSLLGTLIGSRTEKRSFVPVNIGKLYIAADLPSTPGAEFYGYATGTPKSAREMIGQIVMSDHTWTEPKVVVEDFVSTALDQVMTGADQGAGPRRKCTQLTWEESIHYSLPDVAVLGPRNGSAYSAQLVEVMRQALGVLQDQRNMSAHIRAFIEWAKIAIENIQITKDESPLSDALDEFPDTLEDSLRRGGDAQLAITDDLRREVSLAVEQLSDHSALDLLLRKVYHNRPAASVLLLGDGTSNSAAVYAAKHFVASLTKSDRFGKCVMGEPDEASLQQTKTFLKAEKLIVAYQSFDVSSSQVIRDAHGGLFDLIIAPPQVLHCDSSLHKLKSALATSGLLFVSGLQEVPMAHAFFSGFSERWWNSHSLAQKPDFCEETLLARLRSAGFDGETSLTVRERDIALFTSSVPTEEENWTSTTVTFLVSPYQTSRAAALLTNLTAVLHAAGVATEKAYLGDKNRFAKQTIISLVELSDNFSAKLSEDDLADFKVLVRTASRVLWLTDAAQPLGQGEEHINLPQSLSTGLLRTIRSEVPQLRLVHLDIAPDTDLTQPDASQHITNVFKREMFSGKGSSPAQHDRELVLRGNKILVPRITWDASIDQELTIPQKREIPRKQPLHQEGRALRLHIGAPGRLDSLIWKDDPESLQPLDPDYVEIKAEAWSLNFMDVMAAMGQIPADYLGLECAGTVIRVGANVSERLQPGMRVVAPGRIVLRTNVRVIATRVFELPSTVDFATAATIPVVYQTVYQGLIKMAHLRRGETILIHAAIGGVGQAAVQIAHWIGAEVYATVGTLAKKKLLMEQYSIPEDHIFSSRDLSFASGVMRATNGRGVDVVINSLAGEALRQTWNCLASFGRFIEVGKKDIIGNTGLEMAPFMRQMTFISVNIEFMDIADPEGVTEMWRDVYGLFANGTIRSPYPVNRFAISESEKALRFMQTGSHSGKVVLVRSENDDDIVDVVPPKPAQVQLDPSATYVLCGGLGGIGRSSGRMMAERGARRLLFISRSGATTQAHFDYLEELEKYGVDARALKCDTTDLAQVEEFATMCQAESWQIKGVLQCAMVLRDRSFDNMSYEDWIEVTRAKAQGTQHLSDCLPRDMDFFVMLSSISGILGHPGQANYCAANTYVDALAHHRRSQGLAATAIDLGVVSDVGYFAENPEQFEKFDHLAALHVNEQDLHMLLSACMIGHTADGRPIPRQIVAGFGREILLHPSMGSTWQNDRKYLHAHNSGGQGASSASESDVLRDAIATSGSIRAAAREIQDALLDRLGRSLLMDTADIDPSRPLHAYGVDSLVAVEIRNWVFRDLESDISVFDIMSPIALSTLSLQIASRTKLLPKEVMAEQIQEVLKELTIGT